MDDLKVRAFLAHWSMGIEVLITDEYNHSGHDSLSVAEITMKRTTPGEVMKPTFSLQKPSAQVLMDDLWNAGIRPTEGSGSAGSLKATEKHLSDMRTIVSKKLGVELNERKKAP
ncbi:MAG: hypothetical protein ABGX83_05405 [Nitrospira sp.]